MIERLRVGILAGAVGEFSSPESTLCADSYLVSVANISIFRLRWVVLSVIMLQVFWVFFVLLRI